jgi:DNA-binding TFAR19-related protein (PDSD5 family)
MNDWQDQLKEQELEQQLTQLEDNLRKRLAKDAYQRYVNIRAADPKSAAQVLVMTTQYLEKMKLRSIGDEEFKMLLEKMMPKRQGFQIRRR